MMDTTEIMLWGLVVMAYACLIGVIAFGLYIIFDQDYNNHLKKN